MRIGKRRNIPTLESLSVSGSSSSVKGQLRRSITIPASTTSRPLMLFAAENGMKIDFQVVDLFTGEHFKPRFEGINPNRLVPVLEDGDFG